MKKITLFLFSILFVAGSISAQAPKLPAKKGSNFGQKVTARDAISADQLSKLLKEKEYAEVTVKGKVVDVCKMKGCFMYLKTATGRIYIKTKDDAFFVPVALNGKTVLVQGTAARDKESKEIEIQATGILVI